MACVLRCYALVYKTGVGICLSVCSKRYSVAVIVVCVSACVRIVTRIIPIRAIIAVRSYVIAFITLICKNRFPVKSRRVKVYVTLRKHGLFSLGYGEIIYKRFNRNNVDGGGQTKFCNINGKPARFVYGYYCFANIHTVHFVAVFTRYRTCQRAFIINSRRNAAITNVFAGYGFHFVIFNVFAAEQNYCRKLAIGFRTEIQLYFARFSVFPSGCID